MQRRAFLASSAAAMWASYPSRVMPSGISAGPRRPQAEELKDFLKDQCKAFHIPGMSVALNQGNRSETLSIGKASLPFSIDVDADTLFHIGSNGKRFTAAAVLQLVQADRLRLGDSIRAHVLDVPAEWQDRTIEHLLHHVSGIPEYLVDFDWTKPHSRKDVLESASRQAPYFAANSGWAYSNTNYMLLGYALENVTGMTYRQYITEHLLRPAQLERTQVDDSAAIIPARAEGYAFDGTQFRHAAALDGDASGWPDGGIIMSAADSIRWERAVHQGLLGNSASTAIMHAPQRLATGRELPYGCAEFIERLGKGTYYWHTGGVPGFTSFCLRVPDRDLSLLLATNVELDSSRPQRYLGQCVAEAFAPGSTPLGLPPIRDPEPKVTAAAREILLRGENALDPESFAPEIAQRLKGAQAQSVVARFPAPTDFAFVEGRKFATATFRRYRLTYPDRMEHVSIGYTPERKIYWVFWL